MDTRLYFVLGDLGSNLLVALIAGWLSSLLIGVGWNMFIAMLVAMGLGMLVGLLLFFPLGIFFGAMEVMVPVMFTGMLSGMVVGMWAAMAPVSTSEGAWAGLLCGLVGMVIIWIMNNTVRGVTHYSGEG